MRTVGAMTKKLLLFLMLIFCGFLAGCRPVETMDDISGIMYTIDSGTILPELQWHEAITITKQGATLIRNGKVDETQVNTGTWVILVDEQEVEALFQQLETVDCATIQRVEPEDAPEGGETETYTVTYGNGKSCSLVFDPGASYADSESLVEPIEAFVQSLEIPDEARNRYLVP